MTGKEAELLKDQVFPGPPQPLKACHDPSTTWNTGMTFFLIPGCSQPSGDDGKMASGRIKGQRRGRDEREASGYEGKITGSGSGDNLGHCVGRCLLCWAREPAPVDRRVLSVKGAGWQEAWFKAEVRAPSTLRDKRVEWGTDSLHVIQRYPRGFQNVLAFHIRANMHCD